MTEVRNDALDNLLGALTIAGHFLIPEVCLYFRQKLYRGNRSSKLSAVDFDAFDSPNMPCLVEVGIDISKYIIITLVYISLLLTLSMKIDVRWPLVLRPTRIAKLHSHKKLNPNVASLRLFPGINETTVRTFLAPPIQGVVLETYGAGNAPARADLLSALKDACDRGVVIVNCTQCRKGLVTSSYATGRQLAAIGVVAGADMTPECALTKLSYLLGKRPDDPQYVREMMMRNIRGELTVQRQQQQFSAFNRTHALIDMMVSMSAHAKNTSKSEWDGGLLDHDLTMPVEEQLVAEKALLPVILCSAAMANDLDGLRKLYDSHISDMINLNTVDYDGRSPLHLACREGHVEVVEFLLLHGASIHIRDRQGHSPLFVALVEKRAQVVEMLRMAGAHLSEKEYPDMGTIWLKAVAKGDTRFVQLALSAGWSVNWAEPVDGRRAIHVAVCQGRVSVLKCLLAQPNLDLDRKDRWGFSVTDTVKWVQNAEGVNSIDEIAKLIEQHMQRIEKQKQ